MDFSYGSVGGYDMTERINVSDANNTGSREISRLIRLPKNIKQIGQGDPSDRIYIEDYVVTFIRVMHLKNISKNKRRSYFILAGSRGPVQGITATFISGAIMLEEEEVPVRKGIFSNETWEKIYGTLKEEFESLEIMGWAVGDEDWDGINNEILKLHLQNFPGTEKLLYVHDTGNGEDNIYHYTGNNLLRCRGYFIYYDKNEAMQSYMLKINGSKSIENEYVDETVKKIRAVSTHRVPVKNNQRTANRQRKNGLAGRGYAWSTAVLAGLFLVMAVKLNGDNPFSKIQRADDPGTEKTQTIQQTKDGDRKETDTNKEPDTETISEIKQEDTDEKNEEDTKTPDKTDEEASVSDPKIYVVKKGDTLAKISYEKYGTIFRVEDIMELNGIEDGNKIMVGDELKLP